MSSSAPSASAFSPLPLAAEAQQRDGSTASASHSRGPSPSADRGRRRSSIPTGLRELGYVEGADPRHRTAHTPRASSNGFRRWRASWCSFSRRHRRCRLGGHPGGQGATSDDSDRHVRRIPIRSRPVRDQPRATRRNITGVLICAGEHWPARSWSCSRRRSRRPRGSPSSPPTIPTSGVACRRPQNGGVARRQAGSSWRFGSGDYHHAFATIAAERPGALFVGATPRSCATGTDHRARREASLPRSMSGPSKWRTAA